MLRRHYSGVIEATGDTVGPRGLESFSASVAADAGYLTTTNDLISFRETATS